MSGIQFFFDDMLREINAFNNISRDFVAPDSAHILIQLESNLRQIRGRKPRIPVFWGIRSDAPFRTKISEGDYEPNDRGGRYHVYAEITSKWEISCPEEDTKKKTPQSRLLLAGVASTRVDIYQSKQDKEPQLLAVWKTEIGDDQSPGCHFHIAVLQQDECLMFPKLLTVPRFPSFMLTPCMVIEFVFSELFQNKWQRHAASPSSAMATWRNVQLPRLERLLDWHTKVLKESTTSPWTHLKSKKPESKLLAP
jgi:hypothetical protein